MNRNAVEFTEVSVKRETAAAILVLVDGKDVWIPFVVKRFPVQGNNTEGCVYIETSCVGRCDQPYRLDEHHPEFAKVKAALEAGDRRVIFCYHIARRLT